MRLRGASALALVILGSTGCVIQDDVQEIRDTLPRASAIQVKVPGGTQASALAIASGQQARTAPPIIIGGQQARTAPLVVKGGVGSSTHAVLGQTAQFYAFTRLISGHLNLGAAFVLTLVHSVAHFPPTSVQGDTYIWGPWTNALNPAEWRLTVRLNAQGSYEWSLEGRRKAGGGSFEAVVAGVATPGTSHRGSGWFDMDFDKAEELDPVGNDAEGKIRVQYDLEASPVKVIMDFANDMKMPDGSIADKTFHYVYAEAQDGSGDFEFSMYGDLDDNGSAWENTDVKSRWLATGAGRSDFRVAGGDLGDQVLTGSECWGTSFGRSYWTDSLGWHPTEGDPASCAFSDARLPGQ
ncbi:MAG: hypothetical protein HY698_19535 [Deltaproteobacteria bacterium]|nr:hypothetical protein [Deltaproteobacteria bacterium]